MPKPEPHDHDLLTRLTRIVREDAEIAVLVEQKMDEAMAMMRVNDGGPPYGMAEIPIDIFRDRLPENLRGEISLCRAFVMQAGAALTHPERHINSIQRLMAFRNAGTMHVASGPDRFDFKPYPIAAVADPDQALHSTWDVIAPNTWHYPQASDGAYWQTLTFHSASQAEMREEDALDYKIG